MGRREEMTAHVAIANGTIKNIAIVPRSRLGGVPEIATDSIRNGTAANTAHMQAAYRTDLILDFGKIKRVIAIAPKPIA